MIDGAYKNESEGEISILIFEFMNIHIGVDMAQVSEICEQSLAEKKSQNIFQIHEKIPYIKNKVLYRTPRVILVRHDEITTGIVIDMPLEIVSLPTTSILPLPDVIEIFKDYTPVWGVTMNKNRIVLLVDVFSVINNKNA